ncbi:CheR family methyltransferase [Halarsenatibacter silvermanii]|nr:protein-glutamate O-methyltransferase CheR [Halarsenatibacter silvermanii]
MEFKDEAAELLNLNLDGYKLKRVERRTKSLMRRHDIDDFDECLEKLERDSEFRAAYLNHFTINTSEFYRNPDSFEYLEEKILPELLEEHGSINIWSAPCSNGSEPYTLAIILNEMGVKKRNYSILASDIDPEILEKAAEGIYPEKALKNVPDELIDKYFNQISDERDSHQLKKKIRNEVEFKKMDLINKGFQNDWHLILSRNFFIYLTKDLKQELTQKFVDVLNPGCYLFLGNTEFIFNPNKFNLEKVQMSFYQKN